MHTFFVNTSKKSLDDYEILFDIHYENRVLVSMNYAIGQWYDKEQGYLDCVRKMSDMIDGYVELNNQFNLIIYIDLSENKAYSSIQRDAFHDKERDACLRAMHTLFTHVVHETIVQELVNSGRKPQNVLIMFGEDKKFADFRVAANDPAAAAIMKNLFGFIGLPTQNVVEALAKEVDGSDAADKVEAFRQKILENRGPELIAGVLESYRSDLRLWYDCVINEADIPKANLDLFRRIQGINSVESDRIGIEAVSCPYDCYAATVNKCVLALSQLNIALYLLKCVQAESVYENRDAAGQVLPFRNYTVEQVAPLFKAKETQFSDKVRGIKNLSKSYAELGLAPHLSVFDNDKFGLNEYGSRAMDVVVEKKDGSGEQTAGDAPAEAEVIIQVNDREMSSVERRCRPLFTAAELQPFDYNYDDGSEALLKKRVKPQQYIQQAKQVRSHHLSYLEKLKLHVKVSLSNYAGQSEAKKAALLQVGGHRYAKPGQVEARPLEVVRDVSDQAYETVLNQYMEFCAARSVAISDIEDQCDWLASRIHQIEESMKKILLVGLGVTGATLALYIPFLVLQMEQILANPATAAVAVGSMLAPAALAAAVYSALAINQRKQYRKAWKEFKERTDDALQENTLAVQKFDQLLSTVVPSLRWVYEYKLDVEYCAECCRVAGAKIEHHRLKLLGRITAIRNILDDLEYREPEQDYRATQEQHMNDAIDYTKAFCAGEKNRKFYTVFDERYLTEKL